MVASMRLEEMLTAVGERHRTFAAVEPDEFGESFVLQMAPVRLAHVESVVARIAEIGFGYDPKCADGRQCAAIVAVQFGPVVAIEYELAFRSARQIKAFDKRVAGVVVAIAPIALVTPIVETRSIVLFAILRMQLDPRHLDITSAIVAITGIEIYRVLDRTDSRRVRTVIRLSRAIERAAIRDRTVADRVGWRPFMTNGHHARQHGAVLNAVNALRCARLRGLRPLTALPRDAREALI